MNLQTVDTLNYMIAGYGVILGFILGYLVSLVVRARKAKGRISSYREQIESN